LRDIHIPEHRDLLVGIATGDDAGVFRVTPQIALVQTVDFFTPIVDDPYLFGAIAATNSLSDVYAMGGKPLTVMNILCYPIKERPAEELALILKGGADKVAEAGASLVGGHSVEDAEPKFGLAVTGLVDPERVTTNAGAQVGDYIVLTKPLGTGIITTALKYNQGSAEVLDAACVSMATLNSGAAEAMRQTGIGADSHIHAATDITGFGLVGHLYHLAKASKVGIEIASPALPALPEALALAKAGNLTRGEWDNRNYLGENLILEAGIPAEQVSLILDPQTSGGLAICVAEAGLESLLRNLEAQGVRTRAVIGRVLASVTPTLTLQNRAL
jgi:selenide,water dikinase